MEWNISQGLVPYEAARERMQARVAAIQAGTAEELVWLLEHPPLYTAGTSAKATDLLEARGFPVYETGRGGQYTYHGPGQRVVYLMLDLNKRGRDVRAYVQQLERWIILTLREFGIESFIRDGRVGVWVNQTAYVGEASRPDFRGEASRPREPSAHEVAPHGERSSVSWGQSQTSEAKIAALGVRVQKWVTSHGIAINVNPDLSHYAGIVPCGIREFGVTSMHVLGKNIAIEEVDKVLQQRFSEIFDAAKP